ncbi:uncharacterized protein LOC125868732 [Solanum stenotomum]|uniref:uncharacterized protein LOC125868732 n=1 Tax=Solanum stenotomum TaxID=172797 RepID=UPI0020D0838B|nr:uncharacterized protein LOC125868732 [Solanum stenotomum]
MSLLGRLNYISMFIAQLTTTCEPIFRLLKKDAVVRWTDDCQQAFDKIKEYLSKPPVLVPPELDRPLFLYLSVTDNSFGCVLGQHDSTGRKEQAIYYLSKKFTSYEVKLAKWQILLTEFDIIYVTRTAMKAQALADHLAENLVDGNYEPLDTYFPDEEINSVEEVNPDENQAWQLYFDGAINKKGTGIGAILISPTGQHYPATARLRFFCTNNTTEYEACIMGLNMEIDLGVQELIVLGYSDLLIRQAQGEWKTRDLKLLPYKQCVEDLSKRFRSIEFRYIPRFHNELTDALATLASMLPYPGNTCITPLEIQLRDQHGYCNTVEAESDGEPWYLDIRNFLQTGKCPEHANGSQKRTIRRLASGFFLSGEILYKRTPDLNLLRCVDVEEAEKIMNEIHAGVCGPHMNGYVLAKKILRAGYYWLTMERDCFLFVKKCHQCQIHGDLIHSPPSELHPIAAPWPFVAWGMDVIGPIEPKASNGHRFILVAIDYFTKWVEAITFKAITKKVVVDFVHSNIICRFGILRTIITNNAANLNSNLMKEANGAVEAANKNIKKILRKMVQGTRQWHEKLPFALLGYRTTVRTSIGATPYLLVYGTEAVIPAEVEIPSLRIIVEAKIEDTEWVKTQLEQLTLIDEKRLTAVCFG